MDCFQPLAPLSPRGAFHFKFYNLIVNYDEKIKRLLAKKDSCETLLENRKNRLEELDKEISATQESQAFVQAVAQEVQSKLSSKIDGVVNLGLATCFPSYSFEMKYVPARGKTEVQFVVKDGEDVIDPMDQCGGGLVDVLCFCLRIAVFSISNSNNVIVFDEPFKFVSRALRGRVAELLSVLCEKLGLQIIEVTHIEELAESSDKKILIKKIDKVSEVMENESENKIA